MKPERLLYVYYVFFASLGPTGSPQLGPQSHLMLHEMVEPEPVASVARPALVPEDPSA